MAKSETELVVIDGGKAEAPAKKAPATKAAAKKAATKKAPAKAPAKKAPTGREPLPHAGKALPGYDVRWPKRGFDLLKRNDKAPADGSPWLVRCNAHGTTTPVASAKEGDNAGRRADRATWCKECKKAS